MKFQTEQGRGICMGILIESEADKSVYIKFLGLPGDCGPEVSLDRNLAVQLHSMLGQYLGTGERQES